MKHKNYIYCFCFFLLLSFFWGCTALRESTKEFQQRYGQSKYYNDNYGKVMDNLSGFKRYPGKVAIYNRADEPVSTWLQGTIQPGGVVATEFKIHASGDGIYIEGKNSRKIYGYYEVGPTRNGIIIVVTPDGLEHR